jgi:Domain of unknown function (DUF397)
VNNADLEWRKSTHSNESPSGSCVEVAFVAESVAVRDSKNTAGPTLAFPTTTWDTFRADLRGREA